MPQVRANGLDVGYQAEGSGPPLLMLHGASSSGRVDFGPQLALFRQAFSCLAPDARGHGATRWDVRDGFRYDWLVDDLAAFSDALGLDTFHLLGFSMGAATALGFAVRHPERVRTLVLVGITPQREPRASVARRLFDPDRIAARDPAWAAELDRRHDPVQGEGAWERLLPVLAREVAAQELHGPAELRRIDAPALVAVGDRDPFVPVDHAWGLKRQLPDARLLVVPDCGHEVTTRQPALVNEALSGFYRSTKDVAVRRARVGGGSGAPGPATAHGAQANETVQPEEVAR
jgi:pimeloyl-ACP methyl ester carboxylesterase